MKLRNKETGEIGELQITEKHCAVVVGNGTANCVAEIYCSITELNEEWEDYEEPKKYWHIGYDGKVFPIGNLSGVKDMKQIGNYFESKEEAEEAVEKLKAWKRLKDEGLINARVFSMNLNWCNPDDDDWKAYSLLFGGEE